MHIAIHAFEGITMFHLAAPLLVFNEVTRRGLADDWSTVVWSDDSKPIVSAEGLRVSNVVSLQDVEPVDVLVFPSWRTDGMVPSDELIRLINDAHTRGATVVGLCLGAFPVAASGIVDRRSVVTHWAAAARLRELCPRVKVCDTALYLDHGDVLTSAGTASALDACLHLVRNRLGAAAAAEVARHLVVAPHREGDQAQYIERPVPAERTGPISEVMTWVLTNLDHPLTVPELAARAAMSVRNFSRRFREMTGLPPARWIQARRLDEARRLLEGTSWSVEKVGRSCGFASVVTFRQGFMAAYSTTPTSYRRRFTAEPSREEIKQQ